jgi:hypothetical protein
MQTPQGLDEKHGQAVCRQRELPCPHAAEESSPNSGKPGAERTGGGNFGGPQNRWSKCQELFFSRPRQTNQESHHRTLRHRLFDSLLGTCRANFAHSTHAVLWCRSRPIQGKITDRCLQLFGDYGYMEQYHPISRMNGNARVTRIYVRTNEFM